MNQHQAQLAQEEYRKEFNDAARAIHKTDTARIKNVVILFVVIILAVMCCALCVKVGAW